MLVHWVARGALGGCVVGGGDLGRVDTRIPMGRNIGQCGAEREELVQARALP